MIVIMLVFFLIPYALCGSNKKNEEINIPYNPQISWLQAYREELKKRSQPKPTDNWLHYRRLWDSSSKQ